MATGRAETRYNDLTEDRRPFLDRGRECAKYTLPALLLPEEHTNHSDLEDTYQSFGSRAVNSLSAKLLQALMPPNQPFFKLEISEHELQKMNSEDEKANIENALAKIERTVMHEVERRGIRVATFEAIRHLITVGNVLMYVNPLGGTKLWHLDSYVVHRDGEGNPLEIVTHDTISPRTMDEETLQELEDEGVQLNPDSKDNVDVYTYVFRDKNDDGDDVWRAFEEIKGVRVPGSEAEYPKDKCPYIPLRWTTVNGESYGRSYVEEHLGDIKSLETLSKATVEGAAAASKMVFLVDGGGKTRVKTIAEAPNLAVRQGNANDVTVLRAEKINDFNFALQLAGTIEQRLSHAFLLTEVVQRDAERVTAEEIRTMAQQLEASLGGIYSILSEEMQLPLVRVLLRQLQRTDKIPKFPDDKVDPQIIAGMQALGRGHDLDKLTQLIQAAQILGEQGLMDYLNVSDYLTRVATSLGINTEGLIRSEQDVMQRRQAMQQQQAMAEAMARASEQESMPEPDSNNSNG